MDVLRKQNRFVVCCTIACMAGLSLPAWVLFDGQSAAGIWIGSILGLVGYWMIVSMTSSLSAGNGTSKGRIGYMMRYALYGFVLITMTILGIPVLAMLVGFLSHKGSLLVYVWTERKDFHGRTS